MELQECKKNLLVTPGNGIQGTTHTSGTAANDKHIENLILQRL